MCWCLCGRPGPRQTHTCEQCRPRGGDICVASTNYVATPSDGCLSKDQLPHDMGIEKIGRLMLVTPALRGEDIDASSNIVAPVERRASCRNDRYSPSTFSQPLGARQARAEGEGIAHALMQRGVWGGRAEKTNQVSVVSPWCRGARLLESHMSGECETEVVCKKLQDERSWVEVMEDPAVAQCRGLPLSHSSTHRIHLIPRYLLFRVLGRKTHVQCHGQFNVHKST